MLVSTIVLNIFVKNVSKLETVISGYTFYTICSCPYIVQCAIVDLYINLVPCFSDGIIKNIVAYATMNM